MSDSLLNGKVALLTGASGGLGPYIARALEGRGMRLVLTGRKLAALEGVASELRGSTRPLVVPADVTRAEDRERLVAATEAEMGGVDVLVNNAGVERMQRFHQLTPAEIEQVIAVNLTAPMMLAHRVIPGMLERGWGRIVNLASLAGKAPPPHAEPYAVTKAGMIAFTRSLRASYHGTGVSASTIAPGFVRDAGMYQRATQATGMRVSNLLGTSTPEAVAQAVVRALEGDLPEVIVNPGPIRLMSAMGELFPDLGARLSRRIGVDRLFAGWAEREDGS